jgi:hypothetical protein
MFATISHQRISYRVIQRGNAALSITGGFGSPHNAVHLWRTDIEPPSVAEQHSGYV